jgi:peptide chain release factor subunit 3
MPSFRDMDKLSSAPVRCVIVDKYNDMGTIIMGKLESGTITKGGTLLLMPNKVCACTVLVVTLFVQVQVQVLQLFSDDIEKDEVIPGENIKVKLKNIEEDDILPGFTLCSVDSPCKVFLYTSNSSLLLYTGWTHLRCTSGNIRTQIYHLSRIHVCFTHPCRC